MILNTKQTLLAFLLVFPLFAFSQVGINTTTPSSMLDVTGATLLDSYLIDTANSDADGDFLLLVRSKDTSPVGKVKFLDISLRNVGPVNTYKVTISNVQQDEVVNLSTNLPTNKYVVAITNAVFSVGVSAADTSSGYPSYGAYATEVSPITRSGVEYNGVNLSFKKSPTVSSVNGTWTVTLNVYENALIKNWGTFSGSVSAPNYSGTSTNTPLGLQ